MPSARVRLVALAGIALPVIALAQAPAGVPEEKISCLQTELAAAGLPATISEQLLAGNIPNPEQAVKSALGEDALHRVAVACFPEAAGGAPAGAPGGTPGADHPGGPPPTDIPPELASCLKEKVGEEAFNAISSGQRSPTPEEMEKGKACFPSGPPGGGAPPGGDIPPEQRACVVGILGEQTVADMQQGKIRPETISPDLMRRVGLECFKDQGVPLGGNPDVVTCFQELEQQHGGPQTLTGGPPPGGEFHQGIEACLRKDPNYQGPPAFDQGPEACVEQCTQLEGGKFSAEQCSQMCAGQPPTDGGYPTPGTGPEQCLQECAKSQSSEQCQQVCSGSGGGSFPGPYPSEYPQPSFGPFPGEGGYPSPYPGDTNTQQQYPGQYAPSPGENCTTTCTTDATGAQQCQTQCAGGTVQGAATEREIPWLTRLLLTLFGL